MSDINLYQKDLKAIEDDLATKTDHFVELQKKTECSRFAGRQIPLRKLDETNAPIEMTPARRKRMSWEKSKSGWKFSRTSRKKGPMFPSI